MSDVVDRLKRDFKDPEYRHVYDEGFLSSSLATQLKVLRDERGWTQAVLAEKSGMNQSRISEMEDVNFNSWTIRTLRKLAKAFDLRLKISFEEFGTLLDDFRHLNRVALSRHSFADDDAFIKMPTAEKPEEILAKVPVRSNALRSLAEGEAGGDVSRIGDSLVANEIASRAGWDVVLQQSGKMLKYLAELGTKAGELPPVESESGQPDGTTLYFQVSDSTAVTDRVSVEAARPTNIGTPPLGDSKGIHLVVNNDPRRGGSTSNPSPRIRPTKQPPLSTHYNPLPKRA